ncbi:putative signal transducing protein [Saccharicrinis sp. FJH62]|uniref:putative signal transducing protein n=1 Tax=Saccharicrinis sp. FJH62 TaxID=3344657 RepID=UPI0035D4BE05
MDKRDIRRLHSASVFEIDELRKVLEDNNISTLVRDQFQESIRAGFADANPGLVDIYVLDEDFEDAVKLLAEFKK